MSEMRDDMQEIKNFFTEYANIYDVEVLLKELTAKEIKEVIKTKKSPKEILKELAGIFNRRIRAKQILNEAGFPSSETDNVLLAIPSNEIISMYDALSFSELYRQVSSITEKAFKENQKQKAFQVCVDKKSEEPEILNSQ